jgi:hypothetical protein
MLHRRVTRGLEWTAPASVCPCDPGDHTGGDLATRLARPNCRRQAGPSQARLVPVDTGIGPSATRVVHDNEDLSIPRPDDPNGKRLGGAGHAPDLQLTWLTAPYRSRHAQLGRTVPRSIGCSSSAASRVRGRLASGRRAASSWSPSSPASWASRRSSIGSSAPRAMP